jgi:hypothetical protein
MDCNKWMREYIASAIEKGLCTNEEKLRCIIPIEDLVPSDDTKNKLLRSLLQSTNPKQTHCSLSSIPSFVPLFSKFQHDRDPDRDQYDSKHHTDLYFSDPKDPRLEKVQWQDVVFVPKRQDIYGETTGRYPEQLNIHFEPIDQEAKRRRMYFHRVKAYQRCEDTKKRAQRCAAKSRRLFASKECDDISSAQLQDCQSRFDGQRVLDVQNVRSLLLRRDHVLAKLRAFDLLENHPWMQIPFLATSLRTLEGQKFVLRDFGPTEALLAGLEQMINKG